MSKLFKDFGLGVSTAFQGFGFAFRNKMGHFFIYPLIMTIIITRLGLKFIKSGVEILSGWFRSFLGIEAVEMADESWWEMFKTFLANSADYLLSFVLWVVFYFLLHKTIKYVVLILMSPVMALISEKTEEVLTGNKYPFQWGQFAKDVWRGVRIATRNFFIETLILVGLSVINVIAYFFLGPFATIVSMITMVVGLLISSYFWGFSTMDYTNERRRMKMHESVSFIRANKGIAVGNGLIFALFLAIPILGAYLGPVFAIVMCTTGATLAIHKRVDLNQKEYYLTPESEKKKDLSEDDQTVLDRE